MVLLGCSEMVIRTFLSGCKVVARVVCMILAHSYESTRVL